MKKITTFLLAVFVLASCSQVIEPPPVIEPEVPNPIILPSALQKRVPQDNEFAFDLLKKTIAQTDESNVFISPLSVSIALGMAWNGANGATKTEMETALKMSGLTAAEINEYYRIMQTALPGVDPLTKLSLANSIWYKTGFLVKPDFLQTNRDYFNAEVRELDFGEVWAVDTINNWCARKTNDLIKEPLDAIPPDAVMYLINAIYFKGVWVKQFDKEKTYEGNFNAENGTTTKANMMRLNDTIAYYEDETAQYIDLPYGNQSFSMTAILPKYGKTTDDVLNFLTVDAWNNVVQNFENQYVEVRFPRFKVENRFELKPVMQNMGMQLAFTDFADFSNIADAQLLISRIIHSTYVDVNEDGTEAAAVTIVEVELTSVPSHPTFYANKPFVFVIRENSTGVILFIGKIGETEL